MGILRDEFRAIESTPRNSKANLIIGESIKNENRENNKLIVDRSVVRGDAFWDFAQEKYGMRASYFRQDGSSFQEENAHVRIIPHAENAIIDIRKLRDYCLNPKHDSGKNKARLFASALGMSAENAEELRQILLEIVKVKEAKLGRCDEFGQRYTLDFVLEWNNKSATIRSGWIIEHDSDIPRLTTCYPL